MLTNRLSIGPRANDAANAESPFPALSGEGIGFAM